MTVVLIILHPFVNVDIKREVAKTRPIEDKILSKALAAMVSNGSLAKRKDGREVWYTLNIVLDKDRLIKAASEVDRTRINIASQVGAIGDPEEGRMFYGIPEPLTVQVSHKLIRAGKKFQKNVEDIIWDEYGGFLDKVRSKVNGKTSEKILKDGIDSLEIIFSEFLTIRSRKKAGEFFLQLADSASPGSRTNIFQSVLTQSRIGKSEYEDAQIRYWAKVNNISFDEMKIHWEESKKRWSNVNALRQVMNNRDRKWFDQKLSDFIVMSSSLVMVIF